MRSETPKLLHSICGRPMMCYRKLDRGIVAMRDACPHRLLPLSLGLREGDSIRCRYHGLKLGPDGVAEEMPLRADRVNTRICAETFAVAEKHRFIWVWVGERAAADEALIPDLWPCSAEGWVFDGGYYPVAADYRLMVDNLMDLTHETHVHSGSIGQPELMETLIDVHVEGDRAYVSRWMPGVDAPPFWRGALKQDGLVDRWQICEFIPPSAVIIDVGVAPVGAGATLERHDQGVRGFVIDFATPESETSMHYFWGMARSFDQDDAGFTARFKRQQGGVFLEDRDILEAQQRSIDANPDLALQGYNIDQGGVRARQIITRLMKRTAAAPEIVA
jgi:vanillate O-demethylase monooxygenase subunit